ncbi:MAG: imidazole glycerol phosphate synthase subunit HisH [Promethearchaeota archaeon]
MSFNIAIIDYEMGNLKSIYNCLSYLNINAIITDDPKLILDANGVILPGVGAFKDAMNYLTKKDLVKVIKQIVEEDKPLFGICLGLQLIFSKSFEMGETSGLDIIKGKVIAFNRANVGKIPQIGWNNVKFKNTEHFLVKGVKDNSFFYFVHSFYGIPENKDYILGMTKYGETEFCSMLSANNIIATQFHPEKSSKNGIKIFQNFIDFCRK